MVVLRESTCMTELEAELAAFLTEAFLFERMTDKPKLFRLRHMEGIF